MRPCSPVDSLAHRIGWGWWSVASATSSGQAGDAKQGESARCRNDFESGLLAGGADAFVEGGETGAALHAEAIRAID